MNETMQTVTDSVGLSHVFFNANLIRLVDRAARDIARSPDRESDG